MPIVTPIDPDLPLPRCFLWNRPQALTCELQEALLVLSRVENALSKNALHYLLMIGVMVPILLDSCFLQKLTFHLFTVHVPLLPENMCRIGTWGKPGSMPWLLQRERYSGRSQNYADLSLSRFWRKCVTTSHNERNLSIMNC